MPNDESTNVREDSSRSSGVQSDRVWAPSRNPYDLNDVFARLVESGVVQDPRARDNGGRQRGRKPSVFD